MVRSPRSAETVYLVVGLPAAESVFTEESTAGSVP
jgi:hypothetical protein